MSQPPPTPNDREPTGSELIAAECDRLKALLMAKNQGYGNQLLEPRPCFSRASAIERIDARIDEKLARIRNVGPDAAGEDTVQDLAGLLIVRLTAKRQHPAEDRRRPAPLGCEVPGCTEPEVLYGNGRQGTGRCVGHQTPEGGRGET